MHCDPTRNALRRCSVPRVRPRICWRKCAIAIFSLMVLQLRCQINYFFTKSFPNLPQKYFVDKPDFRALIKCWACTSRIHQNSPQLEACRASAWSTTIVVEFADAEARVCSQATPFGPMGHYTKFASTSTCVPVSAFAVNNCTGYFPWEQKWADTLYLVANAYMWPHFLFCGWMWLPHQRFTY